MFTISDSPVLAPSDRALLQTAAGPLVVRRNGGRITAADFGTGTGAGRAADWLDDFLTAAPEERWRQLDPGGTPFQRRVWRQLLEIPAGETCSYGEVAAAIGRPAAARAVGQAVGANPVAVLIPCHRVLAAGGRCGGYRWGPGHKRRLLRAEGIVPA